MERENYNLNTNPNPRKTASNFSVITFLYTLPTFIQGFKKPFSIEDIYQTLPDHNSYDLGKRAQILWSEELSKAKATGKPASLRKILVKMFGWQYFFLLLIIGARELLIQLSVPIILGEIISAYSDGTSSSANMYSLYLVICCLLNILLQHSYITETTSLDLKIQIVCSSLVYQKILKLSSSALRQVTSGQIMTLLTNDIHAFEDFVAFSNFLCISPIQSIIISYITYQQIGLPAIFGICFKLSFLPIQIFCGHLISKYRLAVSEGRDERLGLMHEIIRGIEIIKMYTWEKPFEKLVGRLRKEEMNAVTMMAYSTGTYNFHTLFISMSLFIAIASSTLFGATINAKNAFLVTIYFAISSNTFMFYVPNGITALQQIKVALQRITIFLTTNEVQPHVIAEVTDNYAVSLTNASAKWDDTQTNHTLKNVTVNLNFGSLVAVIGTVGGGKTSLLHVILRELLLDEGNLCIIGDVSYASQEACIFRGTIQQNILFGAPMDVSRYEKVIKCCALERDLEKFSNGDKTVLEEKGVSLSGGQKARINLARAVYRNVDIYLLDDPLSAVDSNVGKQIFDECIRTFLNGKTVVLVTHQLQYLKYANQILVLEKGFLKEQGTPEELQHRGLNFAVYLENDQVDELVARENTENNLDYFEADLTICKTDEAISSSKSILLRMFLKYTQAANSTCLIVFTLFGFIGSQFLISSSFYFVGYWVRRERELSVESYESENRVNTLIYFVITLGAFLLGILRIVVFVNLAMKSSQSLHDSMLGHVIRAPLSFFHLNPSGRILNRFAKDLSIVDDVLPKAVIIMFRVILNVIGILVVICIVSPWFIIPTMCVLICFFCLRKVYLRTNLNILRVESVCRSPIYGHANVTLEGLTTIRVFDVQKDFTLKFNKLLDQRSSVYYLSICTTRALTFWTDCICFFYIVFIMVYFTLDKESNGESVGLAVSQIFQLVGQLAWAIKQLADVENCMISVERILEYSALKSEHRINDFSKNKPPHTWPERGRIEFKNVYLKYSNTNEYVLKNLSFTVESQEKIGVVGRTGSGKSSIISALFQLIETEGTISIDSFDLKSVVLRDGRKKMSIIPQDPVLFSGSVRQNLDPFDDFDDEVLWKALEEVRLKVVIENMEKGLNSDICQSGANLSVGQKQLLCLSRALIHKNKILVLDEATANVDLQTDDFIQETIKKNFNECTVLTVAHRLKTIINSDKVLVMDSGKIIEFDHPHILLQNQEGIFYSMVQSTEKSMATDLESIAEMVCIKDIFNKIKYNVAELQIEAERK